MKFSFVCCPGSYHHYPDIAVAPVLIRYCYTKGYTLTINRFHFAAGLFCARAGESEATAELFRARAGKSGATAELFCARAGEFCATAELFGARAGEFCATAELFGATAGEFGATADDLCVCTRGCGAKPKG